MLVGVQLFCTIIAFFTVVYLGWNSFNATLPSFGIEMEISAIVMLD